MEDEDDFTKTQKKRMKTQRNVVIAEIIIYAAAILIMFGYGGRLAELSGMGVSLISIYGVLKIGSIICLLILVAVVFIIGPIRMAVDIYVYYECRKSLWDG